MKYAYKFGEHKRLGRAFMEELVSMGYEEDPFSISDCTFIVHDNLDPKTVLFNQQNNSEENYVFDLTKQWGEAIKQAEKARTNIQVGDYIVANYVNGNVERKGQVAKVTSKTVYQYLDGFEEVNSCDFEGCRLATHKEIFDAYIEEAKRRGFGVTDWSSPDGKYMSLAEGEWEFNHKSETLLLDKGSVYKNEKWGTTELKFYDYLVVADSDYVDIGCQTFSKSNIDAVIKFLEEHQPPTKELIRKLKQLRKNYTELCDRYTK